MKIKTMVPVTASVMMALMYMVFGYTRGMLKVVIAILIYILCIVAVVGQRILFYSTSQFGDVTLKWVEWEQANIAFKPEVVDHILSFDAKNDLALLKDYGWQMPEENARVFIAGTTFLQKCVDKDCRLQIADCLQWKEWKDVWWYICVFFAVPTRFFLSTFQMLIMLYY